MGVGFEPPIFLYYPPRQLEDFPYVDKHKKLQGHSLNSKINDKKNENLY